MNDTRAYNELVRTLLDPVEQQKFEWVIGALLSGGPPSFVVVTGGSGTGKTTLTAIVRMLVVQASAGDAYRRVVFLPDGQMSDTRVENNMFVFVENNDMTPLDEDMIVIQTSGNRVPVNRHHVLIHAIENELFGIARECSAVFHSDPPEDLR